MDRPLKWTIEFGCTDEVPIEPAKRFVTLLNSNLVRAIEQTMVAEELAGATVELRAASADGSCRIVQIRTAFHIAEMPGEYDAVKFTTPEEAIEHMRAAPDYSPEFDCNSLVVVKEPDGGYRVAIRGWNSTEFDSRVEAEDAMQAFADPCRYHVMPFIEFTSWLE